ncbi:MAG: competence protein ComEC [Natronomonas sp.]|jgi:competence protein ComEC|uniref:ComEC/Rec2 family competence protein n=1 Tax=Natronomonas sp. TaxID=2184060 RepID=UPI0039897FD6
MRRYLAVIALCGLLVTAGCVEAGVELGLDGGQSQPSDTPTTTAASGTFEVHVINVGQADATLLRTENETMLIDSGDWRDDGEAVIKYLEANDVERIDHLVTTHAHADHIGGHEAVIDYYETEKDGVGAVYDSGVPHTSKTYERYLDAVERHNVDLFEVADGDEIPFDGVRARVVNPESSGGDELHADGVAVHLQFGENGFLFTGDAGRETEQRIVDEHDASLDADVYQAGHHGSDTSSSPALLDAASPEVAVISSAYDSQYGHPHDEPLQRFAERDVRALWTAVHGTVVFVSDGETISVRAQHEATADPLEIQDASAATANTTDSTTEQFVLNAEAASARYNPVGVTAGA